MVGCGLVVILVGFIGRDQRRTDFFMNPNAAPNILARGNGVASVGQNRRPAVNAAEW
jgi:hypothetical protein